MFLNRAKNPTIMFLRVVGVYNFHLESLANLDVFCLYEIHTRADIAYWIYALLYNKIVGDTVSKRIPL